MLPDKYRQPAKPGLRKTRTSSFPANRVVFRFHPDAAREATEIRDYLESVRSTYSDPLAELQEDQSVRPGGISIDVYQRDGSVVVGMDKAHYLSQQLEVFF
jgi:hypothetical protein